MKRLFLSGIVFLMTYTLSFGASYYVSNDGNGGDGSIETPFLTIAQLGALSPGDTVYLERGSTFRETYTATDSGAAGLPITITAYGSGADPIIDGEDARDHGITSDKRLKQPIPFNHQTKKEDYQPSPFLFIQLFLPSSTHE